MTRPVEIALSAGKPIDLPGNDRLGYRHLAKLIADGLHKMTPSEGFVVSIQGAWGSGKSSLVNFIIHYLEELEEVNRPLIARFDPWMFSGDEDLTLRFFSFLLHEITSDQNTRRYPKLRKVKDNLARYGKATANLTATVLKAVPVAKDAATVAHDFLNKKSDLHDLKKKVSNSLTQFDGQIIIVIDDIDRLTSEEIRQIFKFTKAVADFPKVTYLLAYDREVVVSALKSPPIVSGDDYLEKIVQAPFDLPRPAKDDLEALLFDAIAEMTATVPIELKSQIHWGFMWSEGLSHFIKTPRHIVRLSNALKVTFPGISNDVSTEDFTAIEALRLFSPRVYDFIRANKECFAGKPISGFGSDRIVEQLKGTYSALEDSLSEFDRPAVRHLLTELFPKYGRINGMSSLQYDDVAPAHLRVSDLTAFDVYFQLRTPADRFTHTTMKKLVSLGSSQGDFQAAIEEIIADSATGATPGLAQLLRQLDPYINQPGFRVFAEGILVTLLLLGDVMIRLVPNCDSSDLAILVLKVLHICEPSHRVSLITSTIPKSASLETIISVMQFVETERIETGGNGYFGVPLFELDDLPAIRKITAETFENPDNQCLILDAPSPRTLLQRWMNFSGAERVQKWAGEICEDDVGLLALMRCYTYERQGYDDNGRYRTVDHSFDIDTFSTIVDVSDIAHRVRDLRIDEQSISDKIATTAFLNAVSNLPSPDSSKPINGDSSPLLDT